MNRAKGSFGALVGQVFAIRSGTMHRLIPGPTVRRLPRYLRAIRESADPTSPISSEEIGAHAGVTSDQVRKDLSRLGSVGKRGTGYDIDRLAGVIEHELGLERQLTIAVVGAGNLGMAIGGYPEYQGAGFEVAALYDINPNRTGGSLGGVPIRHMDSYLADSVGHPFDIGIITTPAEAANEVADVMVEAGTRAILNFAPVWLGPRGIPVRNVRVVEELQILAYYLRKAYG